MSLPNVETTTKFEDSLCYDCPDFIEGVTGINCYGRSVSKRDREYWVSTVRCKKTNGFPVPRLKCKWR